MVIFLPRTRRAQSQQRPRIKSGTSRGSQKILFVEDNEDLRLSTKEALEVLGYSVVAVADGEAAIRAFDDSIEIVVTDVVMPGMNGREVADHLRLQNPDLPVVFTSGYTDDIVLRHGIRESEVDFLPKPFRVDDLTRKIRSVLTKSAAASKERQPLVLVIDSNPLTRGSLKKMLEDGGFNALLESNDHAGIELFKAHSREVRCVILGLAPSHVDTEDTLRKLRDIRATAPILLTGNGPEEAVARRFDLNQLTSFIRSPFDAENLLDTLHFACRNNVFGTGATPQSQE